MRKASNGIPRSVGVVVGLLLLVAASAREAMADEATAAPEWIWSGSTDSRVQTFSKSIELDEAILSAGLKMAADGCRASITINGSLALTLEPYAPTQELDVTRWMRRGKNEFVVTAVPVEGPRAIALSFTLLGKNAERTTLVSDATWTVSDSANGSQTKATSLGKVRPELWGIGRRPAVTSPFENYEQWKQTQATSTMKDRAPKFFLAPGFEITLLRTALPDEGSWISMAFDPQGRLTVSREDRGLLQLTIADDRKSVTHVEPVKLDVEEVRGMVYAHDRLYLNANNSLTLFSARSIGDGTFTDLTVVRKFPGKTGHGRNDLALGPDGAIYSMHGDSVTLPSETIDDRTSPLRESRQLVAAGKPPRREGHLVRFDPRKNTWDLICTGLRNPYGVAVRSNGDVFTYDADNEFDMATPWYRPTRIVQLVEGADYGYRDAGGTWPVEVPDHPDNGLPLLDVGRGSPTSVMFGEQLKFPSPYREALFVLDWSYGRVLAVHLEPRGAGYRAGLELFLQGQPLNVTDLAAGPDGAMYLITGGRKTQSALYRVAYVKPEAAPIVDIAPVAEERHRREMESFAEEQRARRRRWERWNGELLPHSEGAVPSLAFADPMLRHAARIAIEKLPFERWFGELKEPLDPASGSKPGSLGADLQAATIIVRNQQKNRVPDLLRYLLSLDLPKLDVDPQLTAVFVYDQCRLLEAAAFGERRAEIARQLLDAELALPTEALAVSHYGTSIDLRRRIFWLLAEINEPTTAARFVERVAKTLLKSAVQEDRIAGLLTLRNQRDGWTPDARRLYFTTLQDGARFVGGQGMPSFIDRFRNEATATLSDAEKVALADVLSAPAVVDEPLPPLRPAVKKWKIAELAALYDAQATRSAEHSGDAKRGAELFRGALCGRCHRSGLSGPAVGPDLTYVARRFSRRDVLESIVTPSLSVAENYRNAQVTTEGGLVYVGRVVSEGDFRSTKLKLNTDPLRPSYVVELDKQEIGEYHVIGTSPMPEGLLDSFSLGEIADLLAFLESGIAE